jgi:adiponectin receptor
MSLTFHTIMNHSPKIRKFGNALDYLGIVYLIAGSFVPNVYYGYYCDPHLQVAYWSMVSDGIPALINLRINISKRED